MKYLLVFLMVPTTCFAKEYKFLFHTETGHNLQFKTEAHNWEEAYDRAALFCTNFFTQRTVLNEQRLVEIIDVCTNPTEK